LARRALDLRRGHLDHHPSTNIPGSVQIQHALKRFEFAAGAAANLFVAMWLRDFKHGLKPYIDST
jgi:hypothetical protein